MKLDQILIYSMNAVAEKYPEASLATAVTQDGVKSFNCGRAKLANADGMLKAPPTT